MLDDAYLWTLVGYQHRNPVEAGMVERVTDYRWSLWWWFEGMECDWIELKSWRYPPGFEGEEGKDAFRAAVNKVDHAWEQGGSYVGTKEEWAAFQERRQVGREAQAYKERRGRRSVDDIVREVAIEAGFTVADLKGPDRARDVSKARRQAMALMHGEGHKISDIARYFNRTPVDGDTGVSTV